MARLGEFELISRLVESVEAARGGRPSNWGAPVAVASGDDAAVTVPAGATVTSIDALVEGVHFLRDVWPLASVGRKAVGAALSDLAAMGAAPGEAYVLLGVPDHLDEDGCGELASGLADAAARHAVAVLGGDVTRSPVLILGVTVVGHASSADRLVLRSGARSGDVVAVTGELGGAAAGLALLERPELAERLPGDLADALRRRQLEPEPRLEAGRALGGAGATAMIDLSDGLGGDARHLAAASQVRVEVELTLLPVQEGVGAVAAATDTDSHELATTGGEDYELLVTLPPDRFDQARDAVARCGNALTRIGSVLDGDGVVLRAPDGAEREPSGFDQLRD